MHNFMAIDAYVLSIRKEDNRLELLFLGSADTCGWISMGNTDSTEKWLNKCVYTGN